MKPIYRCRVCKAYVEEPVHCGQKAVLLLDGERRLRLSKLMSALLRHIPSEAGLRLDKEGWVSVNELAKAIRERWRNCELYSWVRPEHIIAVALLDPKGRFELSTDHARIRARYGHSIHVKINYPLAQNPPNILYHATPVRNLASILAEGLKPMKRLFVHLSATIEDALEAGLRHGSPAALLEIDANCLKRHGIKLYEASNRVYLAARVPPDCIRVKGEYAKPPSSSR